MTSISFDTQLVLLGKFWAFDGPEPPLSQVKEIRLVSGLSDRSFQAYHAMRK